MNLLQYADVGPGQTRSADVLVSRIYLPGRYAQTTYGCSQPNANIYISDALSVNARVYEHVASHEMMHVGGMIHGGAYDSFMGAAERAQFPTRNSACLDQSYFDDRPEGLGADDIAALSWLRDPQPNGQAMADSGFEVGYSIWEQTNLAEAARTATAGARGSYRFRIRPNSSDLGSSYLQQKVSVLDGGAQPYFRGYADFGRRSASHSLAPETRMYMRARNFTGPTPCVSPDYADGTLNSLNLNQAGSNGTWYVAASAWNSSIPTGWWPIFTPPAQAPAAHAVDLAVRVGGWSTDGAGTSSYFWVDNVTVEQV